MTKKVTRKFFPEKIEIFRQFAWKNGNFSREKNGNSSKIYLEKIDFFLPGSTIPRFKTRLTPLLMEPAKNPQIHMGPAESRRRSSNAHENVEHRILLALQTNHLASIVVAC